MVGAIPQLEQYKSSLNIVWVGLAFAKSWELFFFWVKYVIFIVINISTLHFSSS